jgi:signal transduction histidine kinase
VHAVTLISPHTLSGRIILIVMFGLMIWSGIEYVGWNNESNRILLELPARLAGARIGQAVQVINSVPASDTDRTIQALNGKNLKLLWLDGVPAISADSQANSQSDLRPRRLLVEAIRSNFTTEPPAINVLRAYQFEAPRPNDVLFTMNNLQWQRGAFSVQVQMRNGRWLQIDCEEGEGGFVVSPWTVYYRWIVPVIVITLVLACLIKMAVRPLQAFAAAADDLAQNINRLPLTIAGPVELRAAIQALNNLQKKLLDYISERTRILAAVSHDLKSPITRLRLRAELLHDDDVKQRFRDDLLEMEALANETLEFMRGIEVREPVRPIDINALLDVVQADAMEAGGEVSIIGTAVAPLPGYARGLKRCLSNLVENALLYGERARISVRDSNSLLEIVVSDDGPGIPAEHLDRVFEPFYRIEESRNRATGGSGLGLSIAQNIALAHGGKLVLKNRNGGGLNVTLGLPRNASVLCDKRSSTR